MIVVVHCVPVEGNFLEMRVPHTLGGDIHEGQMNRLVCSSAPREYRHQGCVAHASPGQGGVKDVREGVKDVVKDVREGGVKDGREGGGEGWEGGRG